MKKSKPYWNFWRAVFAGWLIRYPGFFWRGTKIIILMQIILLFSLVSPFLPKEEETEKNTEKISYIKKYKVHEA